MTDEMEDLRKEIYAQHGVSVGRDDPILMLQTINHRLMENSAKAQQAMLDDFKSELESFALRWGDDAKTKAERILNASLGASKEAMAKILQEGATETAEKVNSQIEESLRRVNGPIRASRSLAVINLAASVISLSAAAMAFLALHH